MFNGAVFNIINKSILKKKKKKTYLVVAQNIQFTTKLEHFQYLRLL